MSSSNRIKIYTYKKCSSCKNATNWLKRNGHEFNEFAIRDTPPSISELKSMLAYSNNNIRLLFNSSGLDYRALNLKEKISKYTENDLILLLSENGNLVKRPFLLGKYYGLVGFKEAIWEKVIK